MTNSLKLVSVQPQGSPGVVASVVYAEGRRVADIAIEEAGDWSHKPGHVVWIGLHEPSLELLRKVQGQFGLHELAIEDALKAHQRPKLEQYGEALFIVARTAQMLDGRIAFGETHLFVGRGYVISVRHGASTSYTPVRERCEAAQKAFSEGEDFILYAILDFIVDNYMPVIETVQTEVEEIEDSVLGAQPSQDQIGKKSSAASDVNRLSTPRPVSSSQMSVFPFSVRWSATLRAGKQLLSFTARARVGKSSSKAHFRIFFCKSTLVRVTNYLWRKVLRCLMKSKSRCS